MHTRCAIHDTGCQLMALANSCCTATIHAEGSRSAVLRKCEMWNEECGVRLLKLNRFGKRHAIN